MFRRGNSKARAGRAARATLYGNPKEVFAVTTKQIDPNLTPYGAKRFRTPTHKNEFNGVQGSAMKAVILDIDGTLQTWGQGADQKVLDYCKKHYDQDHVLIVVTARTHDYDYERSFNWLMRNLPYPFIGPFHRACDDPRYASEFKREIAQGFEDMNLYQIVGAADDNTYVNDMWRHWADEHFDNPADFDLLECGYGDYSHWRSGLPAKGSTKPYVSSVAATPAKSALDSDEGWRSYLAQRYSDTPERGDDEFDDLVLDADERVALEDKVLNANPELTLAEVEEWNDEKLMSHDPDNADEAQATDERADRIATRLDLEDEVFASYPDISLVEIQEMDVATLRDLYDHRPSNAPMADAPAGGAS